MLGEMLMPNETHHRVEVITGLAGRRYWPAHEKLRIIEESLVPGIAPKIGCSRKSSAVGWRSRRSIPVTGLA